MRNSSHRLTECDRRKMLDMYVAGESSGALAASFGVSATAVCALMRRRGVSARSPRDRHKRCSLDERAFDNWTPAAAYWAGFLFADGSVDRSRRSITLRLAARDGAHVARFRDFLGSSHSITVVEGWRQRGTDGHQLSIRSPSLVARLSNAGMTAGCPRRACPDLAASRDFWRGVVDGDGHVAIRENAARLELVGNRDLLDQFLAFVCRHAPGCRATVLPHKTIFRVGLRGKYASVIL